MMVENYFDLDLSLQTQRGLLGSFLHEMKRSKASESRYVRPMSKTTTYQKTCYRLTKCCFGHLRIWFTLFPCFEQTMDS